METAIQYGIQLIWTFLELLSLAVLAGSYLRSSWKRSYSRLTLAAVWCVISVCIFIGVDGWTLCVRSVLLTLVWLMLCFRGELRRFLQVVLLSCGLGLAIDVVAAVGFSLLLGIRFRDPAWQEILHFVVLTAAKLIHLLVAYLIHRFRQPDISRFISGKGLFLSLLFPGISLILIVLIANVFQEGYSTAGGVLLACMILAAANVTVLYLLHTAEKSGKNDAELTLLNKQMEIQTQSILSLEKSYRAQRKTAHEFRHHLQTLRDLLDQGQVAAARDYVVQLQDTHSTRILCVNSHHPVVDAVLNQKHQAAVEQKIDVQMQVNDLSGAGVDTEALVVILTNLLDNAIEACERLDANRQIRCSVLLQESLFISVSNTALPVKIENQTIPTSKMPREEHGYGLPGICSILDQLGGEYAFDYADGWFRFVAEIPLK